MIDTDFCWYIGAAHHIVFFFFLFQWFQILFLYYCYCRFSLSADVVVLCIYFEVIHQYLHTHTENICGCKNFTPLKKQGGELCNAHRNAEANRSLSSQCEECWHCDIPSWNMFCMFFFLLWPFITWRTTCQRDILFTYKGSR